MVGLYIHIPFCLSKCKYCDFVSYTDKSDSMADYIDAVIDEAKRYQGEEADTVFIGGGTPAALPVGEMTRLISGVSKYIKILKDAEFTVEVNPNSITRKKAEEYSSLGVNRISIGLQTTKAELLKRIGRTHSAEDFYAAVETVLKAKIHNINVDMMYSLPGQKIEDVVETARVITSLPIGHVSAYALKLEEGTPLYNEHPQLPNEDMDREMFYAIRDILKEKNIIRYEISNFAKRGLECKHNLKYWLVKDYIGLGVSAHSCYKGNRYYNARSIDEYILNNENVEGELQDLTKERIMLKLRLSSGIPLEQMPKGKNIQALIQRYVDLGAAKIFEGRLILTDRGMDVQNYIVSDIFAVMEK